MGNTLSPVEGSELHVCPHCGQLHETVPACLNCERWADIRAYWVQIGRDQGQIEAREELRPQFEALEARLSEFEGIVAHRIAKAVSGPSFEELQRRRYEGAK